MSLTRAALFLALTTLSSSAMALFAMAQRSIAASPVVSSTRAAAPRVKVIAVSPDSAAPSSVITISFDRPIAGEPGSIIAAANLVRLSPPVPARIEWRDPVTIRIVPVALLTAGQRYNVSIDTVPLNRGGARLSVPFRAAITVRHARYLGSEPRLAIRERPELGYRGLIKLLLEDVADTSGMQFTLRVHAAAATPTTVACREAVIAYHVVQQRVSTSQDRALRYSGMWWSFDPKSQARVRVLELAPATPPPEECSADIELAPLSRGDSETLRYAVRTARRLSLDPSCFRAASCADARGVSLLFSAKVPLDSIRRHVHLIGDGLLWPDSVRVSDAYNGYRVFIPGMLKYRTPYRLAIDTTLADEFGRRVRGTRVFGLRTSDLRPALGYRQGMVFVPRGDSARLRVAHVNAATLLLSVTRVPDSLAYAALRAGSYADSMPVFLRRPQPQRTVSLASPVNANEFSDVALPVDTAGPPLRLAVVTVRLQSSPALENHPVDSLGNLMLGAPLLLTFEERRGFQDTLPLPLALVQATDLVVHTKSGGTPMAALVTDRRSGRPIVGAMVSWRNARGGILASATTDAAGIATAATPTFVTAQLWRPQWPNPTADSAMPARVAFVEASTANDRMIMRVQAQDGENQWRRAAGSQSRAVTFFSLNPWEVRRRYRGLAYTERGIYRPGERVYLGVIVREGDAHALRPPLRGDSVKWDVRENSYSMSDDSLYSAVHPLTEAGTAADSLVVPSSWPLGEYVARASIFRGGTWVEVDAASFEVREYRAPEFLVTTRPDSAPAFVGDAANVRVTGTYLFGAPMAGARVRWSATVQPAPPSALAMKPLPSGWVIGMQTPWWMPTPTVQIPALSGSDSLGRDGRRTLAIPTKTVVATQPLVAKVSVSVSDINRQQVTETTTLLLHSSAVYLAARIPGDRVVRAGVPFDVEVQTLSPRGDRVTAPLVYAAIVSWRWSAGASRPLGNEQGAWTRDTVWRDTLRSVNGVTMLHPRSTTGGPGELVLSTRDARGRIAITSVPIWTMAVGAAVATYSSERLPLFVSTTPVPVGQETTVRFESPFDSAQAWTTVEREGVFWQDRRMVTKGANTLRIPVDSTFAPNVIVSVMLLPARGVPRGAAMAERVSAAYALLAVDASRRRLAVTVDVAGNAHAPGDSVALTIRARDVQGKPVRGVATVWATDEGVLSLTNWHMRDPFQLMAEPGARFISDETSDQFDGTMMPAYFSRYLIEKGQVGSGMNQLTGIALQAGITTRDDFRPTAFFRTGIVLDERGEAHLTQRLPDNITTFRITAVVADLKDRAGMAEHMLLVTKPLLVRAALPRFVRTGDSLLAGGVVNTRDGAVSRVAVTASASVMKLLADTTVTTVLRAGGTEVRFPWRVGAGDSARVSLRVTGKTADGRTLSDALATTLPLQPTGRARVTAMSGVVRDRELVTVALPAGTDLARSRITVRVGTSPLSHFAFARRYFDAYPYDCTEQLASQLRVLLAELSLTRAGLPASDSVTTRNRAQAVADAITRRHQLYRGFTYWNTKGESPLWVNAYAGTALLDARDAGLMVSPAVIEQLTEFLDDKASEPAARDSTHGTLAERRALYAEQHATELALAWYLRKAKQPDETVEATLARRLDELTWDDRAWLAELWFMAGRKLEARTLLAALWADVKPAGAMLDVPASPGVMGFYAPTRPMARLMSATMAINPDHPQLAALAERMTQRDRARYEWEWNTLDYGWSMPALASLLVRLKPGDAAVTVSSGQTDDANRAVAPVLLNATRGQSVDASMSLAGYARETRDSVQVRLLLESRGTPAFYVITIDEVSKTPPVTPDRRGIAVERWYERLGDGTPITEARAGDMVRVRLRISVTADRDFVAVEDALPAGLEAVDLSLRTSSALGPFLDLGKRGNDDQDDDREIEAAGGSWMVGFGSVDSGWWTPWDHKELRDDRVRWFARRLWQGTHTVTYIARATTSGRFLRPPAVAEEMYNAGVNGRSDGGWFRVSGSGRN